MTRARRNQQATGAQDVPPAVDPLSATLEQMEIDQVGSESRGTTIPVLTIQPSGAQSNASMNTGEENNPPAPHAGAAISPTHGQISSGHDSVGSAIAGSFPSYRSGVSTSQPVVVQTAQKWDGIKWDLGKNLISHIDDVNRKVMAWLLQENRPLNTFWIHLPCLCKKWPEWRKVEPALGPI
jgi:hypothetical protein